MAVRLNRLHQESVIEKIRASQLIKRLENHALGELEMTATQIQATKILLDKCVGNAATKIDVGGQQDNPINVSIAPELTPEQWLAAFAPK